MTLAFRARIVRAVVAKSLKIRFTYTPWVVQSFVGPLVWLAITVYAYVGVASPAEIQKGFQRYAGTGDFISFLILGQSIFSFFMAMNWRAGMAIERERWYGTLELIFLTPASRLAIVSGESVFAILDSGWMTFLTTVLAAMLFGISFNVADPLAAILAVSLTLMAMMALGVFFAGFYIMTRAASAMAIALQAPVRFFTGTSFPVAALPLSLQYVSYALPVTYGLSVVRKALLAAGGLGQVWPELAALSVFAAGLLASGAYILAYMEGLAKKHGTLHTY